MDHHSLIKYIGKKVKLSLENGFWYRAKIIKVDEKTVDFIEEKGNFVSVDPKFIMMIQGVEE